MVDKIENRSFLGTRQESLKNQVKSKPSSDDAVAVERRKALPLSIEQAQAYADNLALRIVENPEVALLTHQITHNSLNLLAQ